MSQLIDRMIPIVDSVVAGLMLCVPFTVFVVATFRLIPRAWLHSLPPDIARMAGGKTEREERITRYLLLPILLLILPGLSALSAVWLAGRNGVDLTPGGAVLHIYIVWVIVHAWDLLAIDFVYAASIDPERPPIPGTEGARGWKDYGFHIRAFLKAVPMSALLVIPLGVLVAWVA